MVELNTRTARKEPHDPPSPIDKSGPHRDGTKANQPVHRLRAMIKIDLANRQQLLSIQAERLKSCAHKILQEEGPGAAELSLAVVDDETIHTVNRDFLGHDYPTDVISFVLDESSGVLEGEVVASAETAIAEAAKFGWNAEDELLLYVTHGTLHLVGYDDQIPDAKATMRARERYYLAQFGLTPHYADDDHKELDLGRSESGKIVNGGMKQR